MVAKRVSPKIAKPPRKTRKRFIGVDEMLTRMNKPDFSPKTKPIPVIKMPDASEREPVLIKAKVEFSLRAEPLGKKE
jgi:hypothetical protein